MCTGRRRTQVIAAAVLTTIKLGHRRFRCEDFGAALAAFLGEPEFGTAASTKLLQAEVFLLGALHGRVALAPVVDWGDVLLARLLGFAAPGPELDEEEEAAGLPRRALGSQEPPLGKPAPSLCSAATTAVADADGCFDECSECSEWSSEPFAPSSDGVGAEEDAARDPGLGGGGAWDSVAKRVGKLCEWMTMKVAASATAPPRALAAASLVIGMSESGLLSLDELWEDAGDLQAMEELGARVAEACGPREERAPGVRALGAAAAVRASGCGSFAALRAEVAAALAVAAAAAAGGPKAEGPVPA